MDNQSKIKELKRRLDIGEISQVEYENEKIKLFGSEALKPATKSNSKYVNYFLFAIIIFFAVYYIKNGKNTDGPTVSKLNQQVTVNVLFDYTDLYPVHLLYLKNKNEKLFELTMSNPADDNKRYEIQYGFSDLGPLESKTLEANPHSTNRVEITPFSSRLMSISSPMNTSLIVKVIDSNNTTIYSKTWNLKINASDEMPWKIKSQDFTPLIASWVTPKNPDVEELLGIAKAEYGSSMPEASKMSYNEFQDVVKAIFNTLRDQGISYVSSTISFGSGFAQRVRLPELTIKTKSANCIDGSVLMASMFENIGLHPYIVIMPGHAIVAVSRPNDKNALFIETTLIGRSYVESLLTFESTFNAAIRIGQEKYTKAKAEATKEKTNLFSVIDVKNARSNGILPIN